MGGIEEKVTQVTDVLIKIYNVYAPVKKLIVSKPKAPWINTNIKNMINKRNKLRSKFNITRLSAHFAEYKKIRNRVKQMIATSFKNFIKELISTKNCAKIMWSNLKKYGIVFNKLYDSINIDPEILVKTFTLTPCFNNAAQFLINFYNNATLNNMLNGENKFYFSYITPIEIKTAIMSITSYAVGVDDISKKMIMPIIDILLPTICYIFNFCLQNSVFPEAWKQALIKPIAKIADARGPNDFRPISLLCFLAKSLQKIIFNQIYNYVNDLNLLDQYQSGFRKKHSINTALLKITEDIRLAMGRGEVTIMVLLDYSKAFDSLNHNILFSKLSYLNFSKHVIDWFKSYLTGRTHAVVENNNKSSWHAINSGVVQGSPLSPLIFSLYIVDIGTVLKNCFYHLYADDLQLYIHCKPENVTQTVNLINEDLERLFRWSSNHDLILNPNKTQTIIIGNENITNNLINIPKIVINNSEIDYSKYVKNLGILLDENLNWNKQISSVCQKVHFKLHQLYNFRASTPEETRIRLVKTLIMPILDQSDFVYCNISEQQLARLQVTQNKAIRYIFNIKRNEHITPYYSKILMLKMKERRELHMLSTTHKILHGYLPAYLNDMCVSMSNVSDHDTRSNAFSLRAPFVGRDAPEYSFRVKCYRLWNVVPKVLCENLSSSFFKINIEKMLQKRYLIAKY
jgi:hypothetical protein